MMRPSEQLSNCWLETLNISCTQKFRPPFKKGSYKIAFEQHQGLTDGINKQEGNKSLNIIIELSINIQIQI